MPKRAVIAAGGTGGHFYPGLALARVLRERGWEILFLVRRGDPALAALEREGIAAAELDLKGLPRGLGPELLRFPWRLLRALLLARRIVRDFAPGAAVGMGGYLSFPLVAAARALGVPAVLHESNAVLGLANRLCAALGAELFWGLPPVSGSGSVTGTPIRASLWTPLGAAEARRRLRLDADKTTLLVVGGSQGARGLNREVPPALAKAASAAPGRLQVLHLAGRGNDAAVAALYDGTPLRARVLAFLDDMEAAYSAADLVVCRSGASTLAELAAQAKPAVLVPFPSAAANHQEANARVLERAGCALVVLERDLPARLAPLLADLLLSQPGSVRLKDMRASYSKLSLPAPSLAAAALADAIEHAAEKASHSRLQR